MKWLQRFSLIQLTVTSACLFLVIILTLVIKDTRNTLDKVNLAEDDIRLIALLDALEKVAHHHAVERGLTAGFLGSNTNEARQKVIAQRTKADDAVQHFQAQLRLDWPPGYKISENVVIVQQFLQKKAAIRRQIDKLNGSEAFSYYSSLNKAALEAAANITLNISAKSASSGLTNALELAWLKERLGQVRGKVNGVLAKQSVTASTLAEIATYQNEIQALSTLLEQLLSGKQKQDFLTASNSSNTALMRNVTDALKQPDVVYSSLPDANAWFTAATQQIGSIKRILDQQWLNIQDTAATNVKKETTFLYTVVAITVMAILLVSLLYLAMLKLLRSQLGILEEKLDTVAGSGNLMLDVSLDSNNELGVISRQVQHMIMALRDLIVGLSKSLANSDILTADLQQATSVVLTDADATQQKSRDITLAIEQMAATSREIASSTSETLSASQSLKEVADRSLQANNHIRRTIESLSVDMQNASEKAQAMGEQMSEISSIINTINSLSEQTNLLALNAAIEAARAGEHGRGFAVVADEVRQLATASRASTDKISTLLDSLTQASNDVINSISDSAEQTTTALRTTEDGEAAAEEVRQNADQVETLANTMTTATEQQSVTAQQIASNVVSVQQAAAEEHQLARELNKLATDLRENAKVLQNTMGHFKVT
ncbi:methyl-accepting chemotaxis protein [Aestuariibacter sp. A3R04]|uniref:methyl-accepting chemotaxis protein n=1 Tax=Aestuariibacter sp. A3R04 TaxID=2841571 RepID=UPI001C08AD36|nr:methyl-accepting chemotaxis protein [Aestuariibacter sp. A3R04]MBU3023803.1 nitrate- and nitrite sensing domain-containing protein [Aestuariibacter sp. A3R04]